MLTRILLLSVVTLSEAACSGTVVMTPMCPAEIKAAYDAKTDTTGIIVYRAKPVVEVDQLTQANIVPDATKPSLVLLQYPDDLFFGVSAALHRPSPSRNGLYLKSRALSGSRSGVTCRFG